MMRRIGHAGIADAGSTESRDAIERNSAIALSRAIESRTFDLILADVDEGNLEKPFTPETIQSTIEPFLK